MQSKSYSIALAGIATSLAIIFVVLGNFLQILDFSFYFLAGVVLTMPLAKNFYVMGFLSYLATAVFGLLFGGLTSPYYIFFCTFFGIFPFYTSLLQKIKLHKILRYTIQFILFMAAVILTFFISYKGILKSPIVWINQLGNWIYLILFAIGLPSHIIYVFLMHRIQKSMQYLLNKFGKNKNKIDKEENKEKVDCEEKNPFDEFKD